MLEEINAVSITVRVCMAMLLGGILGIERGRMHRPAGFRTYMLVCLGTVMVMITNQYVYERFGGGDPVRMGAQVISGIGFLGAGTIMVTRNNQVKGLTTAAGLWTAACIGLAIGIGFYEGALIGSIAVVIIMTAFHKIDHIIMKYNRLMEIYVELASINQLSAFMEASRHSELEIRDVEISKTKVPHDSSVAAIILLKSGRRKKHADVLQMLGEIPGVRYIEEL